MCTRGAHTPRPTPGWSPFILSPLPRGRQEPTCNKALLSSPTHPWGDPAAIRVGTRTSLCIQIGLCIQTSLCIQAPFSPAVTLSGLCLLQGLLCSVLLQILSLLG